MIGGIAPGGGGMPNMGASNMGGGMTPDVIAAATNMINNLNPMAVLQVS